MVFCYSNPRNQKWALLETFSSRESAKWGTLLSYSFLYPWRELQRVGRSTASMECSRRETSRKTIYIVFKHGLCTTRYFYSIYPELYICISCIYKLYIVYSINCAYMYNAYSSLSVGQFSHSVVSNSLQPHGLSMPCFPVQHQLPEFIQTHVHHVSDAIEPSHPLSSPSLPAFNLSQQKGVFLCVSSSHQVAKVLEFHLQHQSSQWIFRTDFL